MTPTELELGEKQELFAKLWCEFGVWFHTHPSWRMRFQEGFVGLTDAADGDYDGPHLKDGAHYNKVGIDFAFFVVTINGKIQLTRDHPNWHTCGEEWKSMHQLCRWGGDFSSRDYNHFSLFHAGKS